MIIQIKKLSKTAQMPVRSTYGSSGYDLYADQVKWYEDRPWVDVHTGISVAFYDAYSMHLYPRSGWAFKYGLKLRNGVGIVDSDYRDEIILGMEYHPDEKERVQGLLAPGVRVGQFVIHTLPSVYFEETDRLTINPPRNRTGGFGSTGA